MSESIATIIHAMDNSAQLRSTIFGLAVVLLVLAPVLIRWVEEGK